MNKTASANVVCWGREGIMEKEPGERETEMQHESSYLKGGYSYREREREDMQHEPSPPKRTTTAALRRSQSVRDCSGASSSNRRRRGFRWESIVSGRLGEKTCSGEALLRTRQWFITSHPDEERLLIAPRSSRHGYGDRGEQDNSVSVAYDGENAMMPNIFVSNFEKKVCGTAAAFAA